jgi:hypothetical protein
MPPPAGAPGLTAGLGLCCLVLLGVALAPWLVDPLAYLAAARRADKVGREVAPLLPPALETPPLDRFAAIVERPLFTATRRPAPAAPAAPVVSAEGLILGAYRLTGVVVTPTHRLLLLRRQDDRRTIRVAEGEAVDGWTIVRVASDKLVVESAGRQQEIIVREKPRPKRSSP